ncbi:MAG TPA: LutB/LldF family L-lactate oxidation iron-sulfur protein [Trueperaceae bacterium]
MSRLELPVLPFPVAAREALQDSQLRRNLGKATRTIRAKRLALTEELPDWEALREAGKRIKAHTMRNLAHYLEQLEERVTGAGGKVHWAEDAAEANRIVSELVAASGARQAIKVKSLTTDEIRLNDALEAAGIEAIETDLAELIIQLAGESSSHILVPAIHKNRSEIRELFARTLGETDLSDDPSDLTRAARSFLRQRFLSSTVGISGANFGIAQTGTICVVESEGNGRMCTTLPRTLITVMGIEKVVPRWRDMEVFLQLLPRSSTGERMNPYTSFWTGVTSGDGPEEFHLVLVDNGRTKVLASELGREALHCIRCSACLNACPVYERTGGHAYGSVYPGPIGAVLTPQLRELARFETLPFASTLCGACFDACPVKIDIPRLLVHLRGRVVAQKQARRGLAGLPEALAMRASARLFGDPRIYALAQRAGRLAQRPFVRNGVIERLPGLGAWSSTRDLPALPRESFREWWRRRERTAANGRAGEGPRDRTGTDAPHGVDG